MDLSNEELAFLQFGSKSKQKAFRAPSATKQKTSESLSPFEEERRLKAERKARNSQRRITEAKSAYIRDMVSARNRTLESIKAVEAPSVPKTSTAPSKPPLARSVSDGDTTQRKSVEIAADIRSALRTTLQTALASWETKALRKFVEEQKATSADWTWINVQTGEGITVAMFAAAVGHKDPQLLECTLRCKPNLELLDSLGHSALYWSCMWGTAATTIKLLRAGASPGTVTATPLFAGLSRSLQATLLHPASALSVTTPPSLEAAAESEQSTKTSKAMEPRASKREENAEALPSSTSEAPESSKTKAAPSSHTSVHTSAAEQYPSALSNLLGKLKQPTL